MKLYLYEGLNTQDRASVMLWESAGRKLVEAQLTADQITQLFQQIQTAKGNRTLVGKGVDAGGAAVKAWNDLKSKLYNSGPMEGFAAAYDQAAAKLKQATGGDQGAMQYVQKYRDFAKKHPILQGFLYSALIAAAGISSAGLGGAAALALLKTADKALQGEDIRSALYSGAKTGALAYGASKLGDLIRGDKGAPGAQQAGDVAGSDPYGITAQAKELTKDYDPTKYNYVGNGTEINIIDKATGQLAGTYPVDMATADEVIAQAGKVGKLASGAVDTATNVAGNLSSDSVSKGAYKIFADKVANGEVTNLNSYNSAINDALIQAGADQLKGSAKKFAYNGLKKSIRKAAGRAAGGNFSGSNTDWLAQTIKTFGGDVNAASADLAKDVAATAAQVQFESRNLSHKQVQAIFERVVKLNSRMLSEGRLEEGIWDDIKSGAGKGLQGVKNLAGKAVGAVAQGAAKVGRSMTANVSSDALTKAWQAAGSPTDSAEIEKLLQAQGVNPEVIKTVFQANSIPLSVAAAASTGSAGVDPTEPMPDVMSTNRAETPAAAEPATASAGPGAQVAQQQAQQHLSRLHKNPQEPTAGQGAVAQGVQQAQGGQPQGAVDRLALTKAKVDATTKMIDLVPVVARLTPTQKKQLLAQIDKRLG
jgi:hypothetical protein